MAANNNFTLSLRSILEKDKLKENRTNFVDWFRNLRIILKQEKKTYVLEAILEPPPADATNAVKDKHKKHVDDSMTLDTFQQQARQDKYETTIALHDCKMAEGESVSAHVLKMKGYIDHLLGLAIL
ncbi:hypothetical protein MANES_08G076274v8 [Manihot esculenta]|uniref:Uncharacterized protein n=1 Tax=Manihot esculenta TaxID=3983 RepID=A0ACB7H8X7_MANES|nr:hypothetical protein MANES_08G076274v8 [Manihot esculenta]